MNYIIFDLEWNQCPDGKEHENARMPFEIIEIGAIKLNEQREILDQFHVIVKPHVYRWLHTKTREILHINNKNLKKGEPFPLAAARFLNWCGPDCKFCTWGNLDLMELQRNLKYYHMDHLLPGPILYYDVQKLFSIDREDGRSRKSLEYAIDFFEMEKTLDFHMALSDAWYTALVFQELTLSCIKSNFSVDVYQNPKSKKEELHISYENYVKYVSREFPSKESAMRDREVSSSRCPLCRKPARRKIRWFTTNSRNYYSVSLCQEHGLVKGKCRMKKTDDGHFYVVKTLKLVDEKEAKKIQDKQESLRRKRQLRRKQERLAKN